MRKIATNSEIARFVSELLRVSNLETISLKTVYEKVSLKLEDKVISDKSIVYDYVNKFIEEEAAKAAKALEAVPSSSPKKRVTRSGVDSPKKVRKTVIEKLFTLSPTVSSFVGLAEAPKSLVYKHVRQYVKNNGLLNDDNETFTCDETLEEFIGSKSSTLKTFKAQMVDHFIKAVTEDNPKSPHGKKKNSAFMKELVLSRDLADLLQKQTESRPQVVKQLWAYIKENHLQDPNDGRFINCDAKLKKLFKTDRVHMFTLNKILSDHLSPME